MIDAATIAAAILPSVAGTPAPATDAPPADTERLEKVRAFYRPALLTVGQFAPRDPRAHETIARWLALRYLGTAPVGLVLGGVTGCGKTTAARAIRVLTGAKFVRCADLPRWWEDEDVPWRERAMPTAYLGVEFGGRPQLDLILDDLGAERPAAAYGRRAEAAGELLADRYDDWKSRKALTILTTNLTDHEISARYGERIASRLAEMCLRVDFHSVDHRRHRQHQHNPGVRHA